MKEIGKIPFGEYEVMQNLFFKTIREKREMPLYEVASFLEISIDDAETFIEDMEIFMSDNEKDGNITLIVAHRNSGQICEIKHKGSYLVVFED